MLRNVLENKKREASFQLFFLENNLDQSVEVVEVDKIDFEEVKRRLENGESVFIAPKRDQKPDTSFISNEPIRKEPWYFSHS